MLSLLLSGLFLFSSMSAENLRSNNNLIAMSVILSILVSTKRDQDFLKEWLIPDLEQGKHKVSLQNLPVKDIKEVAKESWASVKGHRSQLRGLPLTVSRQIEHPNK